MRKDSWFRGALLSVLFFALLIGGAPAMVAAADSPISTSEEAKWGGGLFTKKNGCTMANKAFAYAAFAGGVAAVGTFVPGAQPGAAVVGITAGVAGIFGGLMYMGLGCGG